MSKAKETIDMTTLRHSRGVDDLEEALMSMDLSELSKTLFDKLNDKWHEVTADGILLDKKEVYITLFIAFSFTIPSCC